MSDLELTRLAIEKVMNWKIKGKFFLRSSTHPLESLLDWNPLSNWGDVGEIVEKMRSDKYAFSIVGDRDGDLAAFGKPVINHSHESKSIPRAITIAALLAVGAITEKQAI